MPEACALLVHRIAQLCPCAPLYAAALQPYTFQMLMRFSLCVHSVLWLLQGLAFDCVVVTSGFGNMACCCAAPSAAEDAAAAAEQQAVPLWELQQSPRLGLILGCYVSFIARCMFGLRRHAPAAKQMPAVRSCSDEGCGLRACTSGLGMIACTCAAFTLL
jgi:hypothetical protein